MIQYLPPGSAWWRDANGPWTDAERLLHDIDTWLRNLTALTYNLHRGDRPAVTPEYLPVPPSRAEAEAEARYAAEHAAERAELLATLARNRR